MVPSPKPQPARLAAVPERAGNRVVAAQRPVATPVLAPAPSDAELVRRACDGDRWAEEAIYRRYVQYVASVAARALRSPQDTRDVVQETFVAAFEQLPSLRDGAALRVWLARIAVSLARRRDRFRSWLGWFRSNPVDEQDCPELTDPRVGPEVAAELALLDIALRSVPCEARIAWVLHRVQGETIEDVAQALGCSLATAKRRLARAEQAVARHLATKEGS